MVKCGFILNIRNPGANLPPPPSTIRVNITNPEREKKRRYKVREYLREKEIKAGSGLFYNTKPGEMKREKKKKKQSERIPEGERTA